MSTMTLFLLCAAFFVGGLSAGAFLGWMLGHDEGVDDGLRAAKRVEGWSM